MVLLKFNRNVNFFCFYSTVSLILVELNYVKVILKQLKIIDNALFILILAFETMEVFL